MDRHPKLTLKEFVGDGSILIIGNGPEYKEVEADVVVRMNYGVQEPSDIWVDGFSYSYSHKEYKVPPTFKYCLCLSGYGGRPERPHTSMPRSEWRRMLLDLGMEKPSTGMMTLWWFKENFPDNQKIITGYNGSINRYSNLGGYDSNIKGPHKFVSEKRLIQEWIENEVFRSV